MTLLTNRAKMTIASVTSGGTGQITLNAASPGFQTFTESGVPNPADVRYVIEEGSEFEIGIGNFAFNTLTRGPIESSNSGSAITVTSAGTVFIGATQDDFAKATALSLVFGR